MWAYQVSRPGRLSRLEVPDPDADSLLPGEVLLRTLVGGICGSDIPKFMGVRGPAVRETGAPRSRVGVPMHELVGRVAASRHPGVQVGARVVGWASRSDGLAEYVATDGDQVLPVPEPLASTAAVLAQPLACVSYALSRGPLQGRHVAVIGVGAIGSLFGLAAKQAGAARVTGVDLVDRAWLDERLGFDEMVHMHSSDWCVGLDPDDRPDVVIEAVGHQPGTLSDAVGAAAVEGTVVSFGIPDTAVYPLDIERLMRRNLTLVAGVTRDRADHLRRGLATLAAHPWLPEAVTTHCFGCADVQLAYETAGRWSDERLKVILQLG
jgi:L-iditol 2-dehydrogenase